jgi:hypothetical protein
MKYVAQVTQVLRPGIHKIGTIRDGTPEAVADLPLPTRVEIELDGGPEQPCMMYRYTDGDDFCGDTWHQNLTDAFAAAKEEYGLSQKDFTVVEDDGPRT